MLWFRALLIILLNLKIKKMKTYFKTVNEILENEKECPFPISVIPNNMGINLCSVDAISWQKQEDGQLTSLTVHFYYESAYCSIRLLEYDSHKATFTTNDDVILKFKVDDKEYSIDLVVLSYGDDLYFTSSFSG